MATAMWLFGVIIVLLLIRLLLVLFQIHSSRQLIDKIKNEKNTKTMIPLGSGGHTMEMLRLINNLGPKFSPRIYVIAKSDKMSQEKITKLHSSDNIDHKIIAIPRSRKVLQSYYTSVVTTIYAILYSLIVTAKNLPDLVICNGPGTCIPICLVVFLFRVLMIKSIKIIFVESICRVETMSLSGKILYFFADEVLVQWPNLQKKYPRTKYIGRLV